MPPGSMPCLRLRPARLVVPLLISFVLSAATPASARGRGTGGIHGTVRDVTGAALPGVAVELLPAGSGSAVTSVDGSYDVPAIPPGTYQISFSLVNFASVRRAVTVTAGDKMVLDAVLSLSLNAEVSVTGKRTFANLADVERPAEDLVGIAQSASQGAITARQMDARPILRVGEVLETVPGVIISQHSGEGKANQYYLRGFNLDHGTDFAATVAGIPVNLPTHAHGHGYLDLNFVVPELVSGVQFSKGPYFADQGDFATAGAANIAYVNAVEAPLLRVTAGGDGYARLLAAASPRAGNGRLLAAFEGSHNDGPWARPDDYRKLNGIVRYSRGTAVNGLALTVMGYRATWNSTDQVPLRAIDAGLLPRFGGLDPSAGGTTSRYSASAEWQRTTGQATTRLTAFALRYRLNLFSNFTYFLDDPVNGDQFEQADERTVSGVRLAQRRLARWGARTVQNTWGAQLRYDDIGTVGLYHTRRRARLGTVRQDAVGQGSVGLFGQNEIEWTPWLRTLAGVRADGYRFAVTANVAANGGVARAGLVSPKAGVVIGPWRRSELYVNAGDGFHSNDARGATITRDPATAESVSRVTPLARARGAEVGVRTVAIPGLQSTIALWTLRLDSELVFVGDAGTTEAGRPSRRAGVEWASYYRPRRWLIFDGDVSWSRARFTDADPAGPFIPGAVRTVVSLGATVDRLHGWFGSARLRYFGPRPLTEEGEVWSRATNLVNLELGRALTAQLRLSADVFNVLNTTTSDIDYFYTSRLPGEPPTGVGDVHLHPALPRSARLTLSLEF